MKNCERDTKLKRARAVSFVGIKRLGVLFWVEIRSSGPDVSTVKKKEKKGNLKSKRFCALHSTIFV